MKRFLSLFLALVLLLGIVPTAAASGGFTDVPEDSWFSEAVEYAVNMGLMNGMGNNKFEPDTHMSRAMLVTVLWRYAGSPKEGTNSFTDVKNGQWYTDAIAWAAENGVVTGVGGGKFEPDGSVTREQLAVKIWGFESEAEYNNVEVYMSFARKKLAFVKARTEIKAVRGVGYELRYGDV